MGRVYTAHLFSALVAALLAGCSGGSGGGGSERQVDPGLSATSAEFTYSGPAPANDEVKQFKLAFYDALVENDRCGECHTPGGSGSVHFTDREDVNRAWQQARSVVNLTDPGGSEVVRRVANGHNCWLGSDQAGTCGTTLAGYIERWAAEADPQASTVQLLPRRAVAPGGGRALPVTLDQARALGLPLEDEGDLLGLLRTYCAGCHAESAPNAQPPFFGSGDDQVAYQALRGQVQLLDPGASRLVLRLDPEGHNCWSDCGENAGDLESAVARLAAAVPETTVDPALLVSMAQVLETDGIVATGVGRIEDGLVARWEFREGSGTTSADTSGVTPEITLSLSGQYRWLEGWGIRFSGGKAQGGVADSAKLFDRLTATGEYSIEAWVAPGNVTQEEAWILGYSGGPDTSNLLLRQNLYNYEAFNRSSVTEQGNAGEPPLVTDEAAELARATLQHVVVTFDPVEGRRIYVNGVPGSAADPAGGGLLNNWNESFALVLGNTTAGTRPWTGTLRMAAVHSRALTETQVRQNFDAGVGARYYLMFSIAELLDREGVCHSLDEGVRTNYCYVVFEVSQFDAGSYLFKRPFFANINPVGTDFDIDLEGIRLGINGNLARIGQGFVNVQARVTPDNSGSPERRLAEIGSIIPVETGAASDSFFLAFDRVGQQNAPVGGSRIPFSQALSGTPAPDPGVRTFDAINATLSAITGVPVAYERVSDVTGKTVAETFGAVRRALPASADFQGFMSSHQMAATQLAAAYCDALVQDATLRSAVFPPGFDFNRPVADPAIDWRNDVVAPLLDRSINRGLVDAQLREQVLDEVELLITDPRDLKPFVFESGRWISDPDPAAHNKRDGLIFCADDRACPASRTAEVVKASCVAVLGSGLVMLQ